MRMAKTIIRERLEVKRFAIAAGMVSMVITKNNPHHLNQQHNRNGNENQEQQYKRSTGRPLQAGLLFVKADGKKPLMQERKQTG